jgi:hypothetical protein
MKNSINLGKTLSREEMKNIVGGIGGPIFGTTCGTQICSKFQACCSTETPSGQIISHCTTTACL